MVFKNLEEEGRFVAQGSRSIMMLWLILFSKRGGLCKPREEKMAVRHRGIRGGKQQCQLRSAEFLCWLWAEVSCGVCPALRFLCLLWHSVSLLVV